MKNIVYIILIAFPIFAQEIDISKALQSVEAGNIQNARAYLKEYKTGNPDDPSVIYLDAVLTPNGDDALKKYSVVYEKFPESKYADASLYRIFSYYYSLGYYKKAEGYLDKLKAEYPGSAYIDLADGKIPEEEITKSVQANTESIYLYTIQAGAFLNSDNAKKLYDQLLKEGFAAEIISKEIGGSLFNIVHVGKFTAEEETIPTLDLLEKKYSIKGRIVTLP